MQKSNPEKFRNLRIGNYKRLPKKYVSFEAMIASAILICCDTNYLIFSEN